jgi:hypothetical protein
MRRARYEIELDPHCPNQRKTLFSIRKLVYEFQFDQAKLLTYLLQKGVEVAERETAGMSALPLDEPWQSGSDLPGGSRPGSDLQNVVPLQPEELHARPSPTARVLNAGQDEEPKYAEGTLPTPKLGNFGRKQRQ